jgi:hypothetical protein
MAVSRWSPRVASAVTNRLGAVSFAAGIGPDRAATLDVRGHKSGRMISFPVIVADYRGERYLIAMLGQKTNWVHNVRADDGRAVLRHGRTENVSLVEDKSDDRAAVLRRYLELAPGARPFFPIGQYAWLKDFEQIVDHYPVFRVRRSQVRARG